jgi:hypothetical protein
MKVRELFLTEKINLTDIRAKLNKIIRLELEKLSGKLEIFDEQYKPLEQISESIQAIKKLELKIAQELKEFGVKTVVIQGAKEAYFNSGHARIGSFAAGYGGLEFYIPFDLVNKATYFGDAKRDKFISLAIAILLHELTHAVQNQRTPTEKSIKRSNYHDDQGEVMIKPYLSNPSEIEALAVNTAEMLMNRFDNDKNKILHSIDNLKNETSKQDTIGTSITKYWTHFGTSEERLDQRIWKRFLKKLHQHIVDFDN